MGIDEFLDEKLGKKKSDKKPSEGPQIRNIIKTIKVSDTIKDIFKNIHENLDKAWGYDNTTGKERSKPKYKNLWRDWTRFKEWFESEVMKDE